MKSNSKMKKGGILLAALTAATALASCGTIEASLTRDQANGQLVELNNITNNTLGQIYDALITSGNSNSEEILNQILLYIANDQFGGFYDIAEIINDDSAITTFLSTHTDAYYGDADITNVSAADQAKGKLQIFYNYLLEQINRSFMSNVGNSDYTDNNMFFEEDFYDYVKGELYTLESVDEKDFKGNTDESGKVVRVGVQVEKSYPFDETTNYGTTQVQKYFQDDYLTVYKDYIEKSILPDLMRSNLVQQYLYDRNYSTFGRSSAREVQFIGLADNADYAGATEALVRAYTKLVICKNYDAFDGVTFSDSDLDAIANEYWGEANNLNFLNDLYLGYFDPTSDAAINAVATKIYTAAGFTPISVTYTDLDGVSQTINSYEETTLGGYLTDWNKITDDRFTNDEDIENDFTGSGTHSAVVGMQLKLDALQTTDYTTEGWYTESTLSGLPSTYSSRLFKITTANDVNSETTHTENEQMNYGYYVEGDYYLSRTSYVTTDADAIDDDPSPILIYDSSTWYIVRVDQAIKNSKIKIGGTIDCEGGDTPTIEGINERNAIVRQIADTLADNSSYTSSANELYIKNAALAYHDDYVYDYFEETFPDLFD